MPSVILYSYHTCDYQVDYGIWAPDQKQVVKEKEASKIISVSWSTDGGLLALGMLSGVVSIRNAQGEEVQRLERRAPANCLLFLPSTATGKPQAGVLEGDCLLVGSWDKLLSFYV